MGVKRLAVFARAFPQTAYVILSMIPQKECHFYQNVTPGVGKLFAPMEAALRGNFIYDLIGGNRELFTDFPHKCITWSVNLSDIGTPDTTQTAPETFETFEH